MHNYNDRGKIHPPRTVRVVSGHQKMFLRELELARSSATVISWRWVGRKICIISTGEKSIITGTKRGI